MRETLERVLESVRSNKYRKDESGYKDAEIEGWYVCQDCGTKVYYSRDMWYQIRDHNRDCDEN